MRPGLFSPTRRSPPLLGIDLRPGHARLMACTRTRRGWRVERCGERELPAGGLQDGQLRQFDPVCKVLRDLVRQADASLHAALALPHELSRRQVIEVPVGLRPWQWRPWLAEQAEQLAGSPVQTQAVDVQLLLARPLTVLLSVCPRESLEDWQGLAEAAGLRLALIDDRLRVMRLALAVLGLAGADRVCALAEADMDRCSLHVWRPGQAVQSSELSMWSGADPAQDLSGQVGWLVGTATDAAQWGAQLQSEAPGRWALPDLQSRLEWPDPIACPADADCYLAAFGLGLRAWH